MMCFLLVSFMGKSVYEGVVDFFFVKLEKINWDQWLGPIKKGAH